MTALVVLTQAAEGSDSLARQLSASGLQVARWPLVSLAPVALDVIKPVLERLAGYNWIFLPSPSAVRLVAQRMKELGIAWPAHARAGLVGPASVEAFRECFGEGPSIDAPAEPPHDARHLVATLGAGGNARAAGEEAAGVGVDEKADEKPDEGADEGAGKEAGLRALVLNRPDGRTEWLDLLRRKAQTVAVVAAYTAEPVVQGPPPDLMWRLQRLQRSGGSVLWVVGARSHLDTLVQKLPAELASWARRQPLLVPHAAILEHARALGFEDPAVYGDRRELVERLQYLGHSHGRTPAEPADREEISVLSLDQQKSSAIPGAGLADDQVTDATVVGESSTTAAPTATAPAPAANPASTAAPTAVPTPAASTTSPSAGAAPVAGPSPAAGAASRTAAGPTAGSPPPRAPIPPGSSAGGRRGGGLWALLLLLLVALLAAGGWWYTQQRFLAAERDGARRTQEADARAARLEEQIRTLRDSQNQLLSRSSTLEAKIADSATQQEQLAALYDEIAKTRGDTVLAEVEQSVMMANQHLELTGNLQAALLALQSAERRLGDSEQSQAIGLRRLILQDIERLKALPEVDLTRSATRLDEIINRVDRLPLLADANQVSAPPPPAAPPVAAPPVAAPPVAAPPVAAPPAAAPAAPAPDSAAAGAGSATPAAEPADPSAFERLYAKVVQGGARSLDAVRDEFRSLVTIRRIDKPDSLLLSPEQKQVARENLKLLLLNARLNLLSRHEELFRQDLARAIESIQRLYDTEQHDVKTAIATLQSLQAQPLAQNLPSLAESLAAARAARAASEKRS